MAIVPIIWPPISGILRYNINAMAPCAFAIHTLQLIRTQESYFTYDSTQERSPVDHDIHFRPGVGARGEETYTPRTLIYDLKGGFGGLRKWGGLYDQQQLGDGPESGGATGVW